MLPHFSRKPKNNRVVRANRVRMRRGLPHAARPNGGYLGGGRSIGKERYPHASHGESGSKFKATGAGLQACGQRGLIPVVQPNGARLWRLKCRFAGKEISLSFGPYPALGIAAARDKRKVAKAMLAEGKNPMKAKGQAIAEDGDTFYMVAKRWHENRTPALNRAHAERVWSRMERDVFSIMGQCHDYNNVCPHSSLGNRTLVPANIKPAEFRYERASSGSRRDPVSGTALRRRRSFNIALLL